MNQDDIDSLQRRTADAVSNELPPGWTFLCCLIAPDGQRYFNGSVHGTAAGRRFLHVLEDSMNVQIWQIPPKALPTKVTTYPDDTQPFTTTQMTLRWTRTREGPWILRNGKIYPTKASMVEDRKLLLP